MNKYLILLLLVILVVLFGVKRVEGMQMQEKKKTVAAMKKFM
tara:strand:- start:162 stop:287 length:126 start_codon:yes stop_codon:yes gene_type:complete